MICTLVYGYQVLYECVSIITLLPPFLFTLARIINRCGLLKVYVYALSTSRHTLWLSTFYQLLLAYATCLQHIFSKRVKKKKLKLKLFDHFLILSHTLSYSLSLSPSLFYLPLTLFLSFLSFNSGQVF